jgi:hypothetical protein
MKYAVFTAVAVLLLAGVGAPATAQEHDTRSIRHKVADAYGVHAFEEVTKVAFTFNVKAGEREVRREWIWWPKESRVRYAGGTWRDGEPFEYLKSDMAHDTTDVLRGADHRFINDSYWLAFPYHVEWDMAAKVTDEGMAPRPIGKGDARKVVVDYAGAGGYTPGDVYELYVGPDYRILEWVFRAGGQADGSPMTWEGEARFGDVNFATDHYNPDRSARVFFTDISVEFAKE